jgi:bifunctional DNase/RNase
MKQTLTDIQVEYDEPIPIYCDNTSAISISKNPVMHSKNKNIPIKYHFLREHVAEKNIRVEYVGTKEQVADIFTKPLPRVLAYGLPLPITKSKLSPIFVLFI